MTMMKTKINLMMKIPKIQIKEKHLSLGIVILETTTYMLKAVKKLTALAK